MEAQADIQEDHISWPDKTEPYHHTHFFTYFNICKYLFKISLIWDGERKQRQGILTAISNRGMGKQLMTKSTNVIPLLFLHA